MTEYGRIGQRKEVGCVSGLKFGGLGDGEENKFNVR